MLMTAPHPFTTAFNARDYDGVARALAPGIVLSSPITNALKFEGRAEVAELLMTVRDVFDELEYVHDFANGDVHVLGFSAITGGRRIDGTDVMRVGDDGLIYEIKVFLRPLTGLAAFTATLAPRLARKRGRLRGFLVAVLLKPLVLMTRTGDRPLSALATGKSTTKAQ